MTVPVPRAHAYFWLVVCIASVSLLITVMVLAANRGGRAPDPTTPPHDAHPAPIAFWGLAEHLGNHVVVVVHTGCEKVDGTTEHPGLRDDRVAVLVGGAADCAAHPATELTTLTLKHGGLGCNEDSPIVDAATNQTLAPAPGRSWPAFSCPAVAATPSRTRPDTPTAQPTPEHRRPRSHAASRAPAWVGARHKSARATSQEHAHPPCGRPPAHAAVESYPRSHVGA